MGNEELIQSLLKYRAAASPKKQYKCSICKKIKGRAIKDGGCNCFCPLCKKKSCIHRLGYPNIAACPDGTKPCGMDDIQEIYRPAAQNPGTYTSNTPSPAATTQYQWIRPLPGVQTPYTQQPSTAPHPDMYKMATRINELHQEQQQLKNNLQDMLTRLNVIENFGDLDLDVLATADDEGAG